MRRKDIGILFILVVWVLSSCSQLQPPVSTSTTTLIPTNTSTSTPTETPTPTPTETPTPTPTPTPIGQSSGKILYWQVEENQSGYANFNEFFISMVLYDFTTNSEEILLKANGIDEAFRCTSVNREGTTAYCAKNELVNTTYGLNTNSILYSMDIGTGELSRLSVLPQYFGENEAELMANEANPDISNDGSFIVFESNRDNVSYYTYSSNLYTLNLADYSVDIIPRTPNNSQRPEIAPNDESIVFMANDGDWEIYTINIDGSNLQKITNNSNSDRFPSWSPDGSKIAFHSDRDGNLEIYIYDIETKETTRVTFNPGIDAAPEWSPDGTYLIYWSDRGGDYDIYTLNLSDLTESKLLDKDGDQSVSIWIP